MLREKKRQEHQKDRWSTDPRKDQEKETSLFQQTATKKKKSAEGKKRGTIPAGGG